MTPRLMTDMFIYLSSEDTKIDPNFSSCTFVFTLHKMPTENVERRGLPIQITLLVPQAFMIIIQGIVIEEMLLLLLLLLLFTLFLNWLLYLAFSGNLGLLCMLHPGMGPLI